MANYGRHGRNQFGNISHVTATIATALQKIGLCVQSDFWTVSTDTQGVSIRMNWLHREDFTACNRTGHTASGEIHGAPRKKKSPAKVKRDRERWVAYKNKLKSQNESKDSNGCEIDGGNSGLASLVPDIAPPVTVCTVNSSLNVRAAEFVSGENTQVKPSTVQNVLMNSDKDIRASDNLKSDIDAKCCHDVQVITTCKAENSCQTDSCDTRTIDVMTDPEIVPIATKTIDSQSQTDGNCYVSQHEYLIMVDTYDKRIKDIVDQGDKTFADLKNELKARSKAIETLVKENECLKSRQQVQGHQQSNFNRRPHQYGSHQNFQRNHSWR